MLPSELLKEAADLCTKAEAELDWKEAKALFDTAEALDASARAWEVAWKKAGETLTREQIWSCEENAGEMIAAGQADQADCYYWACKTAATEYDWKGI